MFAVSRSLIGISLMELLTTPATLVPSDLVCVKNVFSGPYFLTFGLNTERYRIPPYSVRVWENTNQKNLRI